jgi:ribosomal protein S18 acetylase RimI-like enzyme
VIDRPLERTVSEAAVSEREALIALTLAAYRQYEATMPPGAWEPYAAGIRATLSDDASGARIVVAEGGVLVGSALLVPPLLNPPEGRAPQPYPEIRLVAVAPEARRRGIASTLLSACIERTRAAGFDVIGLHSTSSTCQ